MPRTLGKDQASPVTGISNDNIISVTDTDECETIEVTARGSAAGASGKKAYDKGFTKRTVEVECLSHSCTVGAEYGGLLCTAINEKQPLDGPVTYTVTFTNNDN
jgi:hypothetical protein